MAVAGKESENGVYEFPYMMKLPQRTKWEEIKFAIWDPSSKEFLGRTGPQWFRVLLFYFVFYVCLAAFFAICMVGLYATIDYDKPTYTDIRSLIGTNPGLGFRPIGDPEKGALIWYNSKNPKTIDPWINMTATFLKEYDIQGSGRNSKIAATCDFTTNPSNGLACPVNVTNFGDCRPPNFGYDSQSPCVFLKLNKIYNWVPEYYNTTKDAEEAGLPKAIVEKISREEGKPDANQVWISCQGEREADIEHITDFRYYPDRGFPSYYYPFRHKKGEYLSPLIAVQVYNITAGVLVNIECRAWAKNIHYFGGSPDQRMGSVRFEILRDDFIPKENQTTTGSKTQ